MLLNNKNILITGASSGIGKAIAYKCSELGANVRLVARNKDALEQIVNDIGRDRASYHLLDMRNPDEYENVISHIVAEYGKLSGFVHSAGYAITFPFQSMSIDQYQDLFLVNVFSAFELGRILSLKKNRNSEGQSMVFLASITSVVSDVGLMAYGSSKSALVGGARAMALELAKKKIRVNCVSPGRIGDTPMTEGQRSVLSDEEIGLLSEGYPLGLGKATDIASLCAFLLSDESNWITGQNIVIDGGYVVR